MSGIHQLTACRKHWRLEGRECEEDRGAVHYDVNNVKRYHLVSVGKVHVPRRS